MRANRAPMIVNSPRKDAWKAMSGPDDYGDWDETGRLVTFDDSLLSLSVALLVIEWSDGRYGAWNHS